MTRCLIGVLVVITELGTLAALAGTYEKFNVNQIISVSKLSIHNRVSNQLSLRRLVATAKKYIALIMNDS